MKKGLIMAMCLCLLIAINGCVHLLGVTAITGKSIIGASTKKVNKNFIPQSNIDTKETIIQKLGKPDEIIVIDTNKQVLAYETLYRLTNLYALKNGVYQDKTRIRIGEYRANKTLKSKLVSIFPCFQETVKTATSKTPPAPAPTSSSMPTTLKNNDPE